MLRSHHHHHHHHPHPAPPKYTPFIAQAPKNIIRIVNYTQGYWTDTPRQQFTAFLESKYSGALPKVVYYENSSGMYWMSDDSTSLQLESNPHYSTFVLQ